MDQLSNPESAKNIHERVTEQRGWIMDLVTKMHGEGATVEDKLPIPPSDRSQAPEPGWNAEQETIAREVGRRLGYYTEHDVQSGLTAPILIAEGGKVWKISAEAEAIKAENQPKRVIFSGSPNVKLGADEIAFLAKRGVILGDDATEYDAARWVAAGYSDGSVNDEPEVLNFGYEVAEGNSLTDESTGQLVRVGQTASGQSVELLRIDGEKSQKSRPSINRITSMFAESLGDDPTPIAQVTSSSFASRQFNEIEAGLKDPRRQFGTVFYGRETLRRTGAAVPDLPEPKQLAGDLRMAYEKLTRIQALTAQPEV